MIGCAPCRNEPVPPGQNAADTVVAKDQPAINLCGVCAVNLERTNVCASG